MRDTKDNPISMRERQHEPTIGIYKHEKQIQIDVGTSFYYLSVKDAIRVKREITDIVREIKAEQRAVSHETA